MELHLLLGQRLDTPRKLRFPGRFLDDIAALVASVGLEVITRVHKVRRARGLLEKHDQCCGQECSGRVDLFIHVLFLEHLWYS